MPYTVKLGKRRESTDRIYVTAQEFIASHGLSQVETLTTDNGEVIVNSNEGTFLLSPTNPYGLKLD